MTNSIQNIPLSKLTLGKRNVRKTGGGEGIDDLVASIRSHGLLQSLVVQAGSNRAFGVIAGGRRLRALRALAASGAIPADHPVPCRIVDASEAASELSLAENIVRAPMHPADQFEAFCALIDQGQSAAEVAARFNISEETIVKRLKLGRLSPRVLKAYRHGDLDLEEAQAFALSDDHAEQERVLRELRAGFVSASRIRAALTREEVPSTDRRAKCVGAEAYVAAGGALRRDLFDEEGGAYFQDSALLDTLAAEKLAVAADAIKAEGWQWVLVDAEADYAVRSRFALVPPAYRAASDAAAERLAVLLAEQEALLEDCLDNEEDGDARFQEVEAEIESLQPEAYWPADAMAAAGALLSIAHDGSIKVERGLVDKGHLRRLEKQASDKPQPKKRGYSSALVADLTAHRTAALRIELCRKPEVALAAIAHASLINLWYRADGSTESCLDVRMSTAHLKLADDHASAITALEAERAAWSALLPAEAGKAFAWCLQQDHQLLLKLVAFLAALTVDAIQEKSDGAAAPFLAHADQLASALGLDMLSWYTPTAEGFFSRITREQILAAIAEITGSGHGPALEKLAKSELARRAAEKAGKAGWLPAPLRKVCFPAEPDKAA